MSKLRFCDGRRLFCERLLRLLEHFHSCAFVSAPNFHSRYFSSSPPLSPSIHGVFAGPRQAAQAAAEEDHPGQSPGQTPRPGVGERGRQDRQADGGGLLLR